MSATKTIKIFHDRHPFIGPMMWILSIQYFIVQVIVGAYWQDQYNYLHNTISDLGNTACGFYDNRFVCSPQHILMNISFIVLGAFMALGSLLIYQEFKKSFATFVAFSFMSLAGIGTILVGLFPENTVHDLHELGALLPFLLGNLSIVIIGLSIDMPKSLRIYSMLSGVLALIGVLLFVTQNYLGIGIGGMERLAAYPQTIWLIVFGLYISKNRIAKLSKKTKRTRSN